MNLRQTSPSQDNTVVCLSGVEELQNALAKSKTPKLLTDIASSAQITVKQLRTALENPSNDIKLSLLQAISINCDYPFSELVTTNRHTLREAGTFNRDLITIAENFVTLINGAIPKDRTRYIWQNLTNQLAELQQNYGYLALVPREGYFHRLKEVRVNILSNTREQFYQKHQAFFSNTSELVLVERAKDISISQLVAWQRATELPWSALVSRPDPNIPDAATFKIFFEKIARLTNPEPISLTQVTDAKTILRLARIYSNALDPFMLEDWRSSITPHSPYAPRQGMNDLGRTATRPINFEDVDFTHRQ